VYNEDDMPIYEGFLRWTEDELAAFAIGVNGRPIDINVMEYFAVVYFVMMAGSRLRGKRVGIKCDNTAAVAWLQKSRASTSSPIGELLVQTFALYCIAMDITLVPSHVAGAKNVRADDLSRNVRVITGKSKRRRSEPKATRFKGSAMVERAKAGGGLSATLDGFHLHAMESSLEQSTLSSQRSAVKSW
jgi:hypothetical protein